MKLRGLELCNVFINTQKKFEKLNNRGRLEGEIG